MEQDFRQESSGLQPLNGQPTSNQSVDSQPANNYNQPYNQPMNNQPLARLNTKRGLLKYILLSLITFGIYGIVAMSSVSTDINLIASRYDGRKTMHFCLVYFIFSWLTFGIVPIVWYHKISARIGRELSRRNIAYSFGAGSFWGWNVLGSLIIVGPLIYLHKLFKSMNLLSADFNERG
ncbi:MAG: DUF4234 domain-containing protein [Oscillospiraceae bacterium]|nr:DUF4234 domain-containing protein [Oscillospiraceae bacterium]